MSRPVVSACLLLVALPFIAPVCDATQLVGDELSVAGAGAAPSQPVIVPQDAAPDADGAADEVNAPTTTTASGLRDALAQVVIERNVAASERDSLLQQRWLTVVYATIASLLALWFMWAYLRRPNPGLRPVETVRLAPTTRRATGDRPRNATITIRNGATQQPELIERVQTRSVFRSRQPGTTTRRTATGQTTTVMAAPAKTTPPRPVATPAQPSSAAAPTVAPTTTAPRPRTPPVVTVRLPEPTPPRSPAYEPTDAVAPRTVPGCGPSILLTPEVAEVLPDPSETTEVRIARRHGQVLARQGLSLLEVMISLAILATVLASVSGGIFVLSSAHRSANEEAAVSMMMQRWSERIMGADWEWLGREQLDDPLRGAWSWQRPEIAGPPMKGDHPPLKEESSSLYHDANVQLLDNEPARVADLRCYLEYYRPIALELSFTPTDGATARATWDEVRTAYRLPPPVDLRRHADAVVVRLSATWTAQDGGKRRRDLIFARTR